MLKIIVRLCLCSLLLTLVVPAFAGAQEAPAAVTVPASDAVAKAVFASLFQSQSTSCPSPSRKSDDEGVMELIEKPVKGPINLAACGNCPGVCNSDPGCVGKVLGDPCDPTDTSLVCVTAGAGCPAFNCCTCGY